MRAGVAEANRAATTPATILVRAGRFVLQAGTTDATGDLDLNRPMRIQCQRQPPGAAAATTITANGVDRVVEVASTGVTIDGVVLTGGAAKNGAGVLVRAGAALELLNSTLAANAATDQGGGIDNQGTVTVTGSTIVDNTALKKGGGLNNAGTAQLTNTTVHGNSSSAGGGVISTGTAHLAFVTVT